MKSIDISKIFANANNSSSPCCGNTRWDDPNKVPPQTTSTTTSTTQAVPLTQCIIFLNYGEQLFAYNPVNNKNIHIGDFTPGGGDIANTNTKLWFYNGTMFYEYNMQINPFVASFNRTIDAPIPINNLYVGLHAINDTTLITSDTSTTPNRIVTLDISGGVAVETNSFDLPLGKFISGDIVLTAQNKVILTTDGGGNCFLYQYSYPDGAEEIALDLGDTVIYPYGIFEFDNNIYIVTGPGKVIWVETSPPHNLTEMVDIQLLITGASQNNICITNSLIP